MSHDRVRHVLVVDESTETTAVLRALYAQRGTSVTRLRQTGSGISSLEQRLPDVAVIHETCELARHPHLQKQLARTPCVTIGSLPAGGNDAIENQHLSEPFEYGRLVQMIDRMLDEVG